MSVKANNQTRECAPGAAFPEDKCRRGMRLAIGSACFGSLAQAAVSDSSLVILYADMIGGSRFVLLCTTSLQQISLFILFIPAAFLVARWGKKKLILPAISIGVCGLGLAVSAPVFGDRAVLVLMIGLTIFSVAMAFYVAGWFPLLRDIVPSDRRGQFFSRMRMSWQGTVAVFLVISALILRWNSSLVILQSLIAFVGVMLIGRIVCIAKIPETPPSKELIPLRESLFKVFGDRKLMGFGTYLFWLYAFAGATVPVAILMAKLQLKLKDDFIVLLSSCLMTGAIIGFFLGGKMVDRRGAKSVFLLGHFAFGILNMSLLFVHDNSLLSMVLLIGIMSLYGMVFAGASIAVSSEAFALVTRRYSEIGLAVCLGLYYAGIGFSRFLAGWVLDSGMLAGSWVFCGIPMSPYHTLFFFFGIGVTVTCVLLVMVPAVVASSRAIPEVR